MGKAKKPDDPAKAVAQTRPESEEVQAAKDVERRRIFSADGRMGTFLKNPAYVGGVAARTGRTRTGD